MTLMTLSSNDYIGDLIQRWRVHAAVANIEWLDQLRSDALHCINMLKVPTTHTEAWRFTDISPLTKLSFSVS